MRIHKKRRWRSTEGLNADHGLNILTSRQWWTHDWVLCGWVAWACFDIAAEKTIPMENKNNFPRHNCKLMITSFPLSAIAFSTVKNVFLRHRLKFFELASSRLTWIDVVGWSVIIVDGSELTEKLVSDHNALLVFLLMAFVKAVLRFGLEDSSNLPTLIIDLQLRKRAPKNKQTRCLIPNN